MRVVNTRVLPVPAPANTSTGPSRVSTASRCSGLRSAEIAAHGAAPAWRARQCRPASAQASRCFPAVFLRVRA